MKHIIKNVVNKINNLSLKLIYGSLIELSYRTIFFIFISISLIFEIRKPLISITFSELVFINSLGDSPFLF